MAQRKSISSKSTSGTRKAGRKRASKEIRKEMHDAKREGRTSTRERKQAIAIGLSKARRSGADVPAPKKGKASAKTRKKAQQDRKAGGRKRTGAGRKSSSSGRRSTSRKRS